MDIEPVVAVNVILPDSCSKMGNSKQRHVFKICSNATPFGLEFESLVWVMTRSCKSSGTFTDNEVSRNRQTTGWAH